MNFGPSNYFLKIQKSIETQTPKVKAQLGECVGSFPYSFLHSSKCECDFQVALLARTFPCPCFGHKPKVRVMTKVIIF
jgi:hypothetical protein